MKKIYTFFLMLVLLAFTAFGVCSLFDKDDEISVQENRGLKQKPEFSFSSFFSGAYMQELEAYYTDQFPLREALMGANSTLNKFYSYSSGDEGAVIIQTTGNAGAGGIGSAQGQAEATESTQQTEAPQTQTEAPQPGTETEQTGETAEPTEETAQQPEEVSEEDPEFDNPENAETVNSMLVVGDRAMEIVYANEEMEAKYAEAVNSLDEILGPDVKTYSLITPNSTQFYGPEEMREGTTDQKAMIDNVYSQLSSNVTSVDAYSKLRSHIDEYIYFRTDHHWTQLGAYYAYTAFCEAAGLETVELDEFETGLVSNPNTGSTSFLGTFYNNVADHPVQAAAMQANPDTVTYYMPIVKTDATAYTSLLDTGELYGAWNGITTVAKTIGDSYLYMAFIGGDQPIEIIETDVENDKVCMVLKESYGNAFVPFLTSHYSKVVVVDPRKFNTSDTPALYLPDLAELTGVTDLIVINYPHMPHNEYYITRLNRLAGK